MKQESAGLFCPKCGSILAPKETGKKVKLGCIRCSYIAKGNEDMKLQEKGEKVKKLEIVEDTSMKAYPKTKEECPKCACKEAYFWTQQTRAGDEGETRFFECTKCKHRWRDYS